jgi:hypothetical protein
MSGGEQPRRGRELPAAAGRRERDRAQAEEILERADASLLELVDHVLNKGVVVSGELLLGVAGVDLIYLRVTAVLCAADRLLPRERP